MEKNMLKEKIKEKTHIKTKRIAIACDKFTKLSLVITLSPYTVLAAVGIIIEIELTNNSDEDTLFAKVLNTCCRCLNPPNKKQHPKTSNKFDNIDPISDAATTL
jgi:hypothetical protein